MGNRVKEIVLILAGMLCCFGNLRSFGQALDLAETRKITNNALDLMKGKNWGEAEKVLRESLSKCGIATDASKPRGLLNFSLGYLFEIRPSVEPAQASSYLSESAKFYLESVRDLPGNKQVVANLVLVLKRLGREADAISPLENAVIKDPANGEFYYREMGDVYRSCNNMEKALASYSKAAKLSPDNDVSFWRITSVFRDCKADQVEMMLNYSLWMQREGKPEFSRQGYELVMERAGQSQQDFMDGAILHWTNVGATNGWLSSESLSSLPSRNRWPNGAYKELLGILDTKGGQADLSWWRGSRLRRHVGASVYRMVGARHLLAGKPDCAARSYNAALELCPHINDYSSSELADLPTLPLLISVDLSRLYYLYNTLDPDGRKFRDLENELFNDKAQSYAMNDLMAIQYAHTILGLIYAERKIWKSDWKPQNAIFQLEHALSAAEKRASRKPADFQPLPHLEKILAEGYREIGDNANALRRNINAIKGYLDLDGLKEAEETLQNVQSWGLGASAADSKELKLLETILQGRKLVPKITDRNMEESGSEYWKNRVQLASVSSPNYSSLEGRFLNRQKFKVLADIGTAAFRAGDFLQALKIHTEALEAFQLEPSLACAYDVVRLESIKDTIIRTLGIKERRDNIVTGYSFDKKVEYKGWSIWSVGARDINSTLQVAISPDIRLASEIGSYLAKQPGYHPGALIFSISEGAVNIVPMVDNPALLSQIKIYLQDRKDVKEVSETNFKNDLTIKIKD